MPAPNPRAATLALTMFEGRRLLHHPLVLVGAELSVYLFARRIASGQMPVAPRDDVGIGFAMLPLAGATMLVANWAALRGRRHGMEGLYDSLPMAPGRRTAAHLLSVTAPVGLAVLTVVADLVFLTLLGGVGTPNPFELATGPAIVALAGVLGVLLARLAPWIGVASVTAVAFAASWYFPYLLFRITGQVRIWGSFWLFPWFGAPGGAGDWTDAFAGAWHLAYVGGLIAVTACLALARPRPKIKTILAAALALALTVTGAMAQVPSPTATRQLEDARVATGAPGTQVCITRQQARYCAWPANLPWIDRWERPVAGVLARLPATEHGRVLRVRQMELGPHALCWIRPACPEPIRAEIKRAFADGDVNPNSSWPRSSGQGRAELALAASAGAWAVGLPTAPPPESEILTICMPREARVVVALWLAAQSTPQAGAGLRLRTLGPEGTISRPPSRLTLGGNAITPQWPWREAAHAVALLDRAPGEVAARLHRDWARWTGPGTPTAELAEAFGLQPLPAPGQAAGESAAGSEIDGQTDCDDQEVDHAQN